MTQDLCHNCRRRMPSSRSGKAHHIQGKCKSIFTGELTVGDAPPMIATEQLSPETAEVPTPVQNSGEDAAEDGSPFEYYNTYTSIPKKNTVEYYVSMMNEPVFTGANQTLKEYLQSSFALYVSSGMGKATFEELLQRDRVLLENFDPIIPKSLYLVRESLGIPKADQVEHHICTCLQYIFDRLPKEQWISHKDDKCKGCEKPRFNVVRNFDGSLRVTPRKKFYAFNLESQIKRLFRIPDFAQKRGSQREQNLVYQSEHYKWLVGATRGGVAQGSNSVYSVGFDWCQATKSKEHSMGVVSMRCEDLPADLAHKDSMTVPLLYLPGPKEPTCLNALFNLIAAQFTKAAESGIQVSYINSEGKQVEILHKPYWVFIHCDSPARSKLGCFNGANATFCCPYCRHPSVRVEKALKPLGYLEPVSYLHYICVTQKEEEQRLLTYQMGVRRQRLSLENMEHRENLFMYLIKEGRYQHEEIRKELGINGKCDLFGKVTTLHRVHAFLLPFYHLIFLGVLKTFFTLLVKKDPKKKARKKRNRTKDRDEDGSDTNEVTILRLSKLKELNNCIISTSDLGRPPRCLSNIAAFLVEDAKNLWEFQGTLLMHPAVTSKVLGLEDGVLPPLAKEAWGYLRRGIDFFMDQDTVSLDKHGRTTLAAKEAQESLLEFAKICEKNFMPVCTQNLHILICRLLDQEKATGKAKFMNELHIERSLQFFKKNATGKAEPEKVAVQKLLDHYYLEECCGKSSASSITQVSQSKSSPSIASDEDFFTGPTKATEKQMERIQAFCRRSNIRAHTSDCKVYKVAELHRDGKIERVNSSLYNRERTRQSNTVLVDMNSSGSSHHLGVGIVKFFFSVEVDGTETMAAAIQIYRDDQVEFHHDHDFGTVIEIKINRDHNLIRIRCLPLEKILTKVVRLNCSDLDKKGNPTEETQVKYSDFVVPKSQKWLRHIDS